MSDQTISGRIDNVRRPKRVTSTCPECKQRRHGPDAALEDWEAARHPLELRLAALEAQNAEAEALLREVALEGYLHLGDNSKLDDLALRALKWRDRRDALLNPTPESKETTRE